MIENIIKIIYIYIYEDYIIHFFTLKKLIFSFIIFDLHDYLLL